MNKKQVSRLEEKLSSGRSTIELPFFITVREGKAHIGDEVLRRIGINPELYEASTEFKKERAIPLEDTKVFKAHDKDRLYWANSEQTSLKLEITRHIIGANTQE